MRYSTIWLVLICISRASGLYSWCDDSQTFDDYCKTLYLGVAVRGRCFFVAKSNITWENGFAACAAENADLAQIHSELEFSSVVSMLTVSPLLYAYVALKRKTVNPPRAKSINLDTTFWYDGAEMYDVNMPAKEMWIGTRANDDVTIAGADEQCFVILTREAVFADDSCPILHLPLCQITHKRQKFAFVPNSIVNMGIKREYSDYSEQQCARACVDEIQCRGFNIVRSGDGFVCQLCSWFYDDFPSPVAVSEGGHYKFLE